MIAVLVLVGIFNIAVAVADAAVGHWVWFVLNAASAVLCFTIGWVLADEDR